MEGCRLVRHGTYDECDAAPGVRDQPGICIYSGKMGIYFTDGMKKYIRK